MLSGFDFSDEAVRDRFAGRAGRARSLLFVLSGSVLLVLMGPPAAAPAGGVG